jgi:hypothetical protein
MLDTLEIGKILEWDKRTATSFRGVYASDELPTYAPTSSLYIINTDPSTKPGTHWVVVFVDIKRHTDYFDSFGNLPTVQSIEHFLNKNSKVCKYWTDAVQHPLSVACGYHCIFFAVHRCMGFDMNAIVNMYTDDVLHNDEIVIKFVTDKLF